jgi:hypothetical protein
MCVYIYIYIYIYIYNVYLGNGLYRTNSRNDICNGHAELQIYTAGQQASGSARSYLLNATTGRASRPLPLAQNTKTCDAIALVVTPIKKSLTFGGHFVKHVKHT